MPSSTLEGERYAALRLRPRDQEPVRVDRRGRRLRDGRRRPARSLRSGPRLPRPTTPRRRPGSVVAPTMEGSRPLLVEVQALVAPAGYGTPARKASGIDPNRLGLLVAVLGRRAGVGLGGARRLCQPRRRPERSPSPASTCRSRWPWPRRCATARSSRHGRDRRGRAARRAASAWPGWNDACARRRGSASDRPSCRDRLGRRARS